MKDLFGAGMSIAIDRRLMLNLLLSGVSQGRMLWMRQKLQEKSEAFSPEKSKTQSNINEIRTDE